MYDYPHSHEDCPTCLAGREENARLSQQLTCIDIWLNRRAPVTHESATLRHVQEEVERLTRERDEAREKLVAESQRADDNYLRACRAESQRDGARAELAKREEAHRGTIALREAAEAEVARLKADKALYIEEFTRVTAARDGARAELIDEAHAHAVEVERSCFNGISSAQRQAEVKRLEGLILAWDEDSNEHCWKHLEDEGRRIRGGKTNG